MPKEKTMHCVDDLRHAEYYQMQQIFDDLYARSTAGDTFPNLLEIVLMRENILLAYRNIKTNTGGKTAGTDKQTIKDIGRLSPDEVVEKVRYIIVGSKHGYRPKPVRRKDIPKPNGKTRPLGIPCIWDRLIQQCIKQVMEPICEAKFSNNSYGFRPQRSVGHAIAHTYRMLQLSHLHYVIEFDIEGFFDNVNHAKLMRQIWAMGITDKHLLYVIRQILKAPIKMPDGKIEHPTKGTPQGGIISPLLANIVLNELDHWIDSQWEKNPVAKKFYYSISRNGCENLGRGYEKMRKTNLKEMHIVRYADDFRIFCRTKTDAQRILIAVTQWLSERLKLNVSQEKTRIVNVKRKYSDFLGFKIKVHRKGQKYVVKSRMCEKALKKAATELCGQAKNIVLPRKGRKEHDEITLYNEMVMGMQNYYQLATDISVDCAIIHRRVMTILTNRLRAGKSSRLVKKGRDLTEIERKRYGKSAMLRFVAGTGEPLYPIGYIKNKFPMGKKRSICCYSPKGREGLHDNLRLNMSLIWKMMKMQCTVRSIEYADNRISLFSAQNGKCTVTHRQFMATDEIHCHHIIPVSKGGTDKYENLVLVLEPVHRLIHAVSKDVIGNLLKALKLTKVQKQKVNNFREKLGLAMI